MVRHTICPILAGTVSAVITINWMANSLSPSRVTVPLLEAADMQAEALVCVRPAVQDKCLCAVLSPFRKIYYSVPVAHRRLLSKQN